MASTARFFSTLRVIRVAGFRSILVTTRSLTTSTAFRANTFKNSTPFVTTAALSVAAGLGLYTFLNQDKNKIHADTAQPSPVPTVVDPDTKVEVPTVISLNYSSNHGTPSIPHTFYLVGAGVRQVTALYFNVYVAALYADQASLAGIRHNPKWSSTYTPTAFLKGTDASYFSQDLVRKPGTELTLVIQPVRQTTGVHLRQGFMRFLNARLERELKEKLLSEEGGEAVREKLKELEAKFPQGQILTDQKLFFTKKSNGTFRVEFEGRELALINSRWIAERFFEGYLTHEKPITPKFRKSVAEGLDVLAHNK
ncbi:hypothetical protein HDV05_006379 [Chytridiales sp. JEL 0842]|nr:hypothetical protein HDV05_006379 [Chytridiales sp. JEL 0842]